MIEKGKYRDFTATLTQPSDELGTGNTRHFRKSIVNNLFIFVTVHSDYL
jgi:hypothetical protein